MIYNFQYPSICEFRQNIFVLINEYNLKFLYPEFHQYLLDNYPTDIKFAEKLYWFYHNIETHPVCECGSRVTFNSFNKGYHHFCCYKCSRNSESTKDKLKQTNLSRYGVEFNSQSDLIKQKLKSTMIQKYGCSCSLHTKEMESRVRQIKLERYGNPTYTNPDKMKKTKLQKYGDPTYTNPAKGYNTRKLNNSYNASSIELNLKKWLDDHSIEYEYQYKSEEYPFHCDFYFPQQKLYFEIQGNWVHGFHPYDKSNPDDQNTLKSWIKKGTKYYLTAIDTWTVKDPLKRKVAKSNNLNWIEIFSINLDDILNLLKQHHIL